MHGLSTNKDILMYKKSKKCWLVLRRHLGILRNNKKLWRQREMGFNVNNLGLSVSVVLTYSAEVMAGKDVLMQPMLNSIRRAECNTPTELPSGYASQACHCNYGS